MLMAKKVVRKTADESKACSEEDTKGRATLRTMNLEPMVWPRILNAVKTAGLTEEFNKHVGKAGTFVRVR